MKPVQIQFVAPRAWKAIWLFTAVALIAMSGLTGWRLWQQRQIQMGLQTELEQLQAELKAQAAPVSPAINPREASEQAAQRLLQRDWNGLFDAVENPALAQVRLVQMGFDAETGEARLEYELDSFAQGAMLTAALNDGREGRVWQLERLNAAGTNAASGQVAESKVRGIWRARLD